MVSQASPGLCRWGCPRRGKSSLSLTYSLLRLETSLSLSSLRGSIETYETSREPGQILYAADS